MIAACLSLRRGFCHGRRGPAAAMDLMPMFPFSIDDVAGLTA
jgi:hypothetical protein